MLCINFYEMYVQKKENWKSFQRFSPNNENSFVKPPIWLLCKKKQKKEQKNLQLDNMNH